MEAAKKGKKTAKPKKGGNGKKKTKKNNSMNFFSKIMLALLFISVITIAVFLIAGNFKTNNNDKQKTELSFESKKEVKKEKKSKTENEVKEKTSAKEIQKETEKKDNKKENSKTETEVKKQETPTQKTESKSKSESKSESKSQTLSGSWLSSEQGASLTLDEYGYRIDFFGVDASKPMTGNYSIEKNLIVFTSDDGDCKGSGTYRITFYKDNFSLIAKDDECSSRRNILEADWEWIEI